MSKNQKRSKLLRMGQFMLLDAFLITFVYVLVITLLKLIGANVFDQHVLTILPLLVLFKLAVYTLSGLYGILLKHFGFEDAMKVFSGVIVSNFILAILFTFSGVEFLHWIIFIMITPIEIMVLAIPRVAKRAVVFLKTNMDWRNAIGRRTLIIGAGDGGEMILKELYRNKNLANIPVAFLDDDSRKVGSKLLGVDIVGEIDDVQKYIEIYDIEEVIIAIKNIKLKRLQHILSLISEKNVKIKRLPLMEEVREQNQLKLMDVKVEDLLDRDEIELENPYLENFIMNHTVLVTGGGGSIGSELCRQIAHLNPKRLIIFDIYENNAYDIQMDLMRELSRHNKKLNLEVFIGSVYNEQRLEKIFKDFMPDIVFHAAAYKHVPLMEDSPQEAVRTNVLGTYNTAKLADQYKVKHFVLVSSDKAVRPTNIMGATKRYAELIIQHFSERSKDTTFSAVRFGNVLGSNGSVIPLFRKQIESGGPLTVTDKNITRYFMTIPEAVSLILEAATYAQGGEIFVLDMGEPVKIKDLAEKMIRLAGLVPYKDIDIVYTGLRPGEKLYEELLVDSDTQVRTKNKKIFIEHADEKNKEHYSHEHFNTLISAIDTLDLNTIKAQTRTIISSYQNGK